MQLNYFLLFAIFFSAVKETLFELRYQVLPLETRVVLGSFKNVIQIFCKAYSEFEMTLRIIKYSPGVLMVLRKNRKKTQKLLMPH